MKKMVDEGFVYIWYDAQNKKYYIGKHQGNPDDSYTHSSTVMKRFNKDNIPKGFRRRILLTGTKEEIAFVENTYLRNRKNKCWDRYHNLGVGDPRYVSMEGENNNNYKDGFFTGRTKDRAIYKATDKIRNAIRHKENPERGRCRMKARYYLLKGDEDIAKQWFDAWVLQINNQPESTKGNYKKKIPIWNEWKKIQKKG
tara:strand:- start:4 stop:597 length:594 start_codon:yes stop_codon:yes gene_type:complete